MIFNTLLVTKNEVNYRRMNLKLKTGPRAYYQSQPLVISGIAFDCMYPIETTPPVTSPIGQLVNVHEGDEVLVNVGSDNMICGTVYSLSYDKPSQVTHVPAATRTMVRGQVAGDMAAWVDHDESSAIIKMDDGKAVLEYDFGKPVAINGLDVKDARAFIRVWYHDGSHWVPLVWGQLQHEYQSSPCLPGDEGAALEARVPRQRFEAQDPEVLSQPAHIDAETSTGPVQGCQVSASHPAGVIHDLIQALRNRWHSFVRSASV